MQIHVWRIIISTTVDLKCGNILSDKFLALGEQTFEAPVSNRPMTSVLNCRMFNSRFFNNSVNEGLKKWKEYWKYYENLFKFL